MRKRTVPSSGPVPLALPSVISKIVSSHQMAHASWPCWLSPRQENDGLDIGTQTAIPFLYIHVLRYKHFFNKNGQGGGSLSIEGLKCEVGEFGHLEFINTHRLLLLLLLPRKHFNFSGSIMDLLWIVLWGESVGFHLFLSLFSRWEATA